MTQTDSELLRSYLAEHSDAAFGELVKRHLGLVYAAALRQLRGDVHLARDVAQIVFLDLARKASTLRDRPTLAGWLYTSTRFTAAKFARTELRRAQREREAFTMQDTQVALTTESDWAHLRQVLDDAMHELDETDREAVLLRYFQQRDLRTVGAVFGVSDEAARKRVERALARLRVILERQGILSTEAALASGLAAVTITATPMGLAASITQSALAGGALIATGAGTTIFNIMSTKLKSLAVGVCLLAGVAGFIMEHSARQALTLDNERLREQLAQQEAARANPDPSTTSEAEARRLEQLRQDYLELMRLRSEVTNLRRQARATAEVPAASARPVDEPLSPVIQYMAEVDTTLFSGDTLMTGGWTTPTGNLYIFATPTKGEFTNPTGEEIIVVSGKWVELSEAALASLTSNENATNTALQEAVAILSDLGSPTNEKTSSSRVLKAHRFQALIKTLERVEGVDVLSAPQVATTSGRQARIDLTEVREIFGGIQGQYPVDPSMDVIPSFRATGSGTIDLMIRAGVARRREEAEPRQDGRLFRAPAE